jgi:single-strand DNA-binding protein
MNSVAIAGRAAREIELRHTQSGKSVANGTMAVQRKFKNAQGEYEADFIRFVAWGKTGELMNQYIGKGEHFGITGELQQRNWEKDDGTKVEVIEVNVNSFDFPQKPKGNNQSNNQPQNNNKYSDDPFAKDGKPIDISDDDLPF